MQDFTHEDADLNHFLDKLARQLEEVRSVQENKVVPDFPESDLDMITEPNQSGSFSAVPNGTSEITESATENPIKITSDVNSVEATGKTTKKEKRISIFQTFKGMFNLR